MSYAGLPIQIWKLHISTDLVSYCHAMLEETTQQISRTKFVHTFPFLFLIGPWIRYLARQGGEKFFVSSTGEDINDIKYTIW